MGDGSTGIRRDEALEDAGTGRGVRARHKTGGGAEAAQVRLVYRPLFLADVERCADYISTEAGEAVAAAWYAALKKTLEHIQRVPQIGRVRQDLPMPEIRTLNLRK